jgi:sugar lactone lactonase YvrE
MPPTQSIPDVKPRALMTDLSFGESPRWGHDGRFWLADWGTKEILAVDPDGRREVVVHLHSPSFQPIRFDSLPDGRLLIVSSSDRLL